MADVVNHPSHYTSGKYEVIDFIESWCLGFHLGNAVKYIVRAGKKHPEKEIEDLQKAIWYLNRAIEYGIDDIENTILFEQNAISCDDFCADKRLNGNRTAALRRLFDVAFATDFKKRCELSISHLEDEIYIIERLEETENG